MDTLSFSRLFFPHTSSSFPFICFRFPGVSPTHSLLYAFYLAFTFTLNSASCAFPWVKWRSAEVMHNLFSSGSCLLHSYNSSIYMFVCVEEGEERLPDYQLTHHTYLEITIAFLGVHIVSICLCNTSEFTLRYKQQTQTRKAQLTQTVY